MIHKIAPNPQTDILKKVNEYVNFDNPHTINITINDNVKGIGI